MCGQKSLSFDAFNMLSLPIPTHSTIVISLKVIPYQLLKQPYQISLTISEYTTLYELKQKLQEFLIQKLYRGDSSQYMNPFTTVLKTDKSGYSLDIVSDEKFVKNLVSGADNEIVIF